MANASSKRIASSNEKALGNLQNGMAAVNLLAPLIRLLLSLITSRRLFPRTLPFVLYVLSTGASVFVWRWFVTIGTPKRSSGGSGDVRVGEDLSGKGVVELAWDLIYMTWICTLGSAILGDWVWWLLLLVPGFGAYKLFNTIRPILAMVLPGIFGSRQSNATATGAPGPAGAATAAGGARAGGANEQQEGESKRQAKLRARMEKGDKRVQQASARR